MIKTGYYTGNGVDDRPIDIGVNLANKNNAYVIIDHSGASRARHRIEYGQGDLAMAFDSVNDAANRIQAFTSTGFQIGTDSSVNTNTNTYRYIVFWEEP